MKTYTRCEQKLNDSTYTENSKWNKQKSNIINQSIKIINTKEERAEPLLETIAIQTKNVTNYNSQQSNNLPYNRSKPPVDCNPLN